MGFEYFSLVDIGIFCTWFFIFALFAHLIYARNKHKPEYKYYLTHFYWKIIAGVGFGLVYTQILEGDTTSYWKGSVALNKLLFETPSIYLYEISSGAYHPKVPVYFLTKDPQYYNAVYREANSWSVCRMASIPALLSFGSYFTVNLWMSIISGWISWRFYLFTLKETKIESKYVAIAVLFIPSIGFWCNAITKDCFVYMGILIGTVGMIRLFKNTTRKQISTYIYLIISIYILFQTRSFILLSMATAFFITFLFQFNRNKAFITRFLTRIIGVSATLSALLFYLNQSGTLGELSAESLLDNAALIQQDFANNATYTGGRYDLGEIEFTPLGVLKIAPAAIVIALFRPAPWDDISAMLLINCLESAAILYFSISLIYQRISRRTEIKQFATLDSENTRLIVTFSIVFILIMAFFVGFSSGLYGVLVRMRAPLLLFFLIVIFNSKKNMPDKTTQEHTVEPSN